MTRYCFLIGLVFFVVFGAVSAENEFDVRKVRWGMTVDEVKASESWKFVKENTEDEYVLSYEGILLEKPVILDYRFVGEGSEYRLKSATYQFFLENKLPSLSFHINLWGILKDKYGMPLGVDAVKDRQTLFAVLEKGSVWQTERTQVGIFKFDFSTPGLSLPYVLSLSYTSMESIKRDRAQEQSERDRLTTENF